MDGKHADLKDGLERDEQTEGIVKGAEHAIVRDINAEQAESIGKQTDTKVEQKDAITESADSKNRVAEGKPSNELSIRQSKDGKTESSGSVGRSKLAIVKAENAPRAKHPAKRKRKVETSKTSGVAKLKRKFGSFGETVKKLWDVWSRFKTKSVQISNPSVSEKTLGVPGFEEIACIEAEVPDIMMMDKDRVRTSCKECMKDPPSFPTKEQIKAKLIAADRYYGVQSSKTEREQSDATLEHEADYYDTDGRVVRPSWRFIMERPLVEQYVLMTNYIRKVSVLSEMKENESTKKYIEEEDSGSDTEYRKFEQKYIRERRELLKPIKKPKTQEIAVQTSFEPKIGNIEDLKESVSEISLYPESEESTNSPDASAVTIVTSRDYTSPLQSDFDGRTTDKSSSHRVGNWWESPATCEPSESFQTSYESFNKNTSSGTDGQPVPVHSARGKTSLQSPKEAFSNDSDSRIAPNNSGTELITNKKQKDAKKVSFSPVVTYYQGPNRNGALYNLPEDQDISMGTKQKEPQQLEKESLNPQENPAAAESFNEMPPGLTTSNTAQNKTTEDTPEDKSIEETSISQDKLPNNTATRPKLSKRKVPLGNIILGKKQGQILSVSLPDDWHENRVLGNKKPLNVAVSRTTAAANQQVSKKVRFIEYEEIPDVEYSNPRVYKAQGRADVDIQTQTPVVQRIAPTKFNSIANEGLPPLPKLQFDHRNSGYTNQTIDQSPVAAQMKSSRSPVAPPAFVTEIPSGALNLSERHGVTEISDSQKAKPHSTRNWPKGQLQGTVKRWSDGGTAMPEDQTCTPDGGARLVSTPKTEAQPPFRTGPPLGEKSSYCQTQMTGTCRRNDREADFADPHQKQNSPFGNISLITEQSHSKQQHSTDTDGPSSSSNEHIKLKASPACFFKVATPTDLSKISVDEFYPDVPEIDAELSQTNETKTSSASQGEISFANKDRALRYTQDSEFHRITKKEENAILQKSTETTKNKCLVTSKAPEKEDKIVVSAGVGIKADKGIIATSKYKGQNEIINSTPGKDSNNSSRQSNIIQKFEEKISIGKRTEIELEGGCLLSKRTRTNTCERNFGGKVTEESEVKTRQQGEVETANTQAARGGGKTQLRNDKDMSSRQTPKSTGASESASVVPTGSSNVTDLSQEKGEENERTVENEQNTIKKGKRVQQYGKMDNDDDKAIPIQRQTESLPMEDDGIMLDGRTKLFMRTLSSLAEETSSAVESASSLMHEKVADKSTPLRQVGELKTIFEKKQEAATAPGEVLIQGGEIPRESRQRVASSKGTVGLEGALENGVSIETLKSTDDAKMTVVSHLGRESEGKPTTMSGEQETSNSEGNQHQTHASGRSEVPNTSDNVNVKLSSFQADTPKKSESGLSGGDKTPSPSIQEDSTVQRLSQIDVIKASAIYSNTSMYVSSSEERGGKLTKARTGFQPMTMDDELASTASCTSAERTSRRQVASKENFPGTTESAKWNNNDSKLKSNHEGNSERTGATLADESQKEGKEKDTGEFITKTTKPSSENCSPHDALEELEQNQTSFAEKEKPPTHDNSNPSEAKQWLMDVIPVLSKNTRLHGYKPHKRICLKEPTEAEAVKYRQDAVKPVFRFLKTQREMEENKD